MTCKKCGAKIDIQAEHDSCDKVLTSSVVDNVYRRRICRSCGWIFYTVEIVLTEGE